MLFLVLFCALLVRFGNIWFFANLSLSLSLSLSLILVIWMCVVWCDVMWCDVKLLSSVWDGSWFASYSNAESSYVLSVRLCVCVCVRVCVCVCVCVADLQVTELIRLLRLHLEVFVPSCLFGYIVTSWFEQRGTWEVCLDQAINQSITKMRIIHTHTHTHYPFELVHCMNLLVDFFFFAGVGGGRRRAMCDVCLTLGVCILRTFVSFFSFSRWILVYVWI